MQVAGYPARSVVESESTAGSKSARLGLDWVRDLAWNQCAL